MQSARSLLPNAIKSMNLSHKPSPSATLPKTTLPKWTIFSLPSKLLTGLKSTTVSWSSSLNIRSKILANCTAVTPTPTHQGSINRLSWLGQQGQWLTAPTRRLRQRRGRPGGGTGDGGRILQQLDRLKNIRRPRHGRQHAISQTSRIPTPPPPRQRFWQRQGHSQKFQRSRHCRPQEEDAGTITDPMMPVFLVTFQKWKELRVSHCR